jgi:glycosyltransferase involved in cell wall biosynthesis
LHVTHRVQLAAVSRDLSRRLARALFVPNRRILVVPNGIPLELASPTSRRPGEALRLISVGNLYPVKNHAFAIRAIGRLRQRGVSVTLDILGRGSEEARLREQVHEAKLEESVRLLGFREDVEHLLRQAHAFLSTSHHEGMPIAFLEAMAAGLPIVAPAVGGIPEMVVHDAQGLLFTPGDLDDLVRALELVACNDALRIRLAQNARLHVQGEFSVDRMVDTYLALYQRAACP